MGDFSCSFAMLELVASLVVDLSDQLLTVHNSDLEVVRVIQVSTG